MSELEKRLARALAACTFLPGSRQKRFARQMGEMAEMENRGLSYKQKVYLCDMVQRYRRQIEAGIVLQANAYKEVVTSAMNGDI